MFIVAFGVVLVWWGAAVTTKDVGLAVPDWPLCYRKINPEGWWRNIALLLEHGHRWLATITGSLVAILFAWSFFRHWAGALYAAQLLVVNGGLQWLAHEGHLSITRGMQAVYLVGLIVFVVMWRRFRAKAVELTAVFTVLLLIIIFSAKAADVDPLQRVPALAVPAVVLAAGLLGWWIHGTLSRRWNRLTALCGGCLLLVELQAVLGGMRVTEMSDVLGIVHGCLGQVFWCVLLWVALASSTRRPASALRLAAESRRRLLTPAILLLAAVFLQLVWGASVRHLHRVGLPAPDVLTTNGHLFPGFDDAAVFFFFLHKAWGLGVAGAAVWLAWRTGCVARDDRTVVPLRRLAAALVALPGLQIALGVAVVLSTTGFWVTNFHVLNGLAILGCSFAFVVKVVARPASAANLIPAVSPATQRV